MKKAVIYARYSSDNQREESIDAQIMAIKEYASKNDFTIVRIYIDEARSATTDNRPEFLNLIRDSKSELFEAVLVHKLDRFARNRYDSAFYKHQLKTHGVNVVSVLEQLDNSPESVILESVLEGMAEYYSKNLAREVMKGLKQNALNCLWNGGSPPLGYVVSPNQKLVIDPAGASSVRRIFELFSSGYGYGLIAETLNKEGHKTATGGPFYKSSIHTILRNEKYNGVYVYNKSSAAAADGSRNSHRFKNDEEIIRIEGGVPAIVDPILWKEVQKRMDNRKKGPRPSHKANTPYLLTGLIWCSECAGAYVGDGYTKRPGYKIYSCTRRSTKVCTNKSVSKAKIEAFVVEKIKTEVLSDTVVDSLVPIIQEKLDSRKDEYREELILVRTKMKETERKLSRLLDAIEEGIASPDVKERISNRRQDLDDLLEREVFLLSQPEAGISEEEIKSYLVSFRGGLDSQDPEIKRKTIETFVEKVMVFPDRFESHFKIDKVWDRVGGDKGIRTPGLLNAIQARSQLRHIPISN